MLTVMMECRDQETELVHTLSVLVAGAVEGLVSDVVVLDHGSQDGTARVADAAGCRFYRQWEMRDVLSSARGEWLLLVEPGSRPLAGWIEAVGEHMALAVTPARFSTARDHRRPFYMRFGRSLPPLEEGYLLPKRHAVALVRSGMRLSDFVAKGRPRTLTSEIVPSWVLRAQRG